MWNSGNLDPTLTLTPPLHHCSCYPTLILTRYGGNGLFPNRGYSSFIFTRSAARLKSLQNPYGCRCVHRASWESRASLLALQPSLSILFVEFADTEAKLEGARLEVGLSCSTKLIRLVLCYYFCHTLVCIFTMLHSCCSNRLTGYLLCLSTCCILCCSNGYIGHMSVQFVA